MRKRNSRATRHSSRTRLFQCVGPLPPHSPCFQFPPPDLAQAAWSRSLHRRVGQAWRTYYIVNRMWCGPSGVRRTRLNRARCSMISSSLVSTLWVTLNHMWSRTYPKTKLEDWKAIAQVRNYGAIQLSGTACYNFASSLASVWLARNWKSSGLNLMEWLRNSASLHRNYPSNSRIPV